MSRITTSHPPESIVIVGGGIVGLCTAHFLTQGGFEGQLTIVDRDWSHTQSSTARSVAAIRQQFRLEPNIQLSIFGNQFFASARQSLGTDIGYEPAKYLVLAGTGGVERIREAGFRQRSAGAEVELFGPDELVRKFHWLRVDGLGGGLLSVNGEGWIDPVKTLEALTGSLREKGVDLRTGIARSYEISDGVVKAANLDDGAAIEADAFVNAAGPQAGHLMARSDLPLPIESRKRCAFVFEVDLPPDNYPCLVDPTVAGRSIFSRPYGDRFLAVTSPDPSDDPDTTDLSVDPHLFEEIIRPGLGRRVSSFGDLRLVDSWAGHYEVNTYDQNAFIGRHPKIGNLYLNCGFSGHGVMHAPGAGRGIAELLLRGGYQSLDLSDFSLERVRKGTRLDDLQPSERREIQAGI